MRTGNLQPASECLNALLIPVILAKIYYLDPLDREEFNYASTLDAFTF